MFNGLTTPGIGEQATTLEEKEQRANEIFEVVRRNLELGAETQASYYNLRRRHPNIQLGDQVLLKQRLLSTAVNYFAAKYDEP